MDSAFNAQTKIGWNNFLKGRVSTQWRDIMQDHYEKFHSLPFAPIHPNASKLPSWPASEKYTTVYGNSAALYFTTHKTSQAYPILN